MAGSPCKFFGFLVHWSTAGAAEGVAGLRPDRGGRDARAPGGASSDHSCSARARAPGRQASVRAGAAEPSRFVSLRDPSCNFVDHSFILLSQAGFMTNGS